MWRIGLSPLRQQQKFTRSLSEERGTKTPTSEGSEVLTTEAEVEAQDEASTRAAEAIELKLAPASTGPVAKRAARSPHHSPWPWEVLFKIRAFYRFAARFCFFSRWRSSPSNEARGI